MSGVLDLFRLDGQVALVTGAGSGLGQAFALAMAEAGADVACVDLRQGAAALTARYIGELGRRAAVIPADVTQEADATAMVEKAVAELGRLDIAFCNAGIAGVSQPLIESKLSDWQAVIDLNLTGVYLTAREVAKV